MIQIIIPQKKTKMYERKTKRKISKHGQLGADI